MVSYPKAHLYVEADGADDLDLLVLVQKLDAYGTPLQAFTVPNQSAMAHDLTDHGATVLRYKCSDGRLRVSMRRIDETHSTDDVPAHIFDGSRSSAQAKSSRSTSSCSRSDWLSIPANSSVSSSAPGTCSRR